ncbi:5'-methylthioadenosine/S-adenosylhomocysteine nucleosidase [Candidatus Ishikawella capsulata]|uniref:5'-methylthioadenosine/S-adenosylhomocysteine nucleosidase n=1 Tax=Candidatus Ishikawaella capsulata Mpkobe TaxID=476281 RepID=C5WCL1_9ENTR|nr:5'-methylthioadenosine/S-adenosylhomocysteine nucleosidase [Candidatus Ishikawaella capsulata]BAH83067.1 5'-methylthioadenosine/S-adenosylhomocysteine nucleosidase [Candidatus Ishikawaella capsulata Mpkobe]
MKVGLIGAMEEEIIFLINKIENRKKKILAGYNFYTGILNDIKVIILQSNIGKTAAAISTTLMLKFYQPDIVINTGSAGGLSPLLKTTDIVVSEELLYYDVDVTAFGYLPGQMAGCPEIFTADRKLITLVESTIKELKINILRGLIISGDTFINGGKQLKNIRRIFPKAIAVDMEATAIAHVCYQFRIPFVAIRSISDLADSQSHLNFKTFLNEAAQRSFYMIDHLMVKLRHSDGIFAS